MRKELIPRRRSKFLKLWAVIAVVVAALSFYLIVSAANCEVQSTTPPSSPGFADRLKSNTLSLAALLAALTGIFVFIGKVFKPVKRWFVRWVKKSLDIVDVAQAIDQRFEVVEKGISNNTQTLNKQYQVMTGQNQALEEGVSALLMSMDGVSRKLGEFEETNRALIRDSITKTFYKYCKRQAIPIHERENMNKMFDTYKNLGGNSYIASIMRVVDEWEVLSGDDAPSIRTKLSKEQNE